MDPHDGRKGYGREALALLTDWLFEYAAAEAAEASTDAANAGKMPAVAVGQVRCAA